MSAVCRLAAIQMPDVVSYSRFMDMNEVATLHPCEVVMSRSRATHRLHRCQDQIHRETPQQSADHHRA